jgi:Holliday junction resolvase RusA-like endonuclease
VNASQWEGPIGIRISFGIKAPLNTKHGYPKSPDLDKLIRGVLDALTGVCYVDDSQVTFIEAQKIWQPVTVIEVWRIEKQSPKGTNEQATFWQEDAVRVEKDTP